MSRRALGPQDALRSGQLDGAVIGLPGELEKKISSRVRKSGATGDITQAGISGNLAGATWMIRGGGAGTTSWVAQDQSPGSKLSTQRIRFIFGFLKVFKPFLGDFGYG